MTSRPERSPTVRSRSSSSGRSTSRFLGARSTMPARRWRSSPTQLFGRPIKSWIVAGVTGTSGKTTTTFLLAVILEAAGLRPGLIGTIETRVGGERQAAVRTTPEAVDLQRSFRAMLDAGDRSCALEATSHGSQLRRLDRVRFGCLVFTNLSQDHPRPARDDGGLLPGQASTLHRDPAPGGDQHRRPVGQAAARRSARCAHVRAHGRGGRRAGCAGRYRPQAPWQLQR